MEDSVDPKSEAMLPQLAADSGRKLDHVVVESAAMQPQYDTWFRKEVRKGVATLERGETLSDEDVVSRIDQLLRSA